MTRDQLAEAYGRFQASAQVTPNTVYMLPEIWREIRKWGGGDLGGFSADSLATPTYYILGCRVVLDQPDVHDMPRDAVEFARVVDTNIEVDTTSSPFDMLRTVKQQLQAACRENPDARYDRVVTTIEAIRKYLLEPRRGAPPVPPETEQRSRVVQL